MLQSIFLEGRFLLKEEHTENIQLVLDFTDGSKLHLDDIYVQELRRCFEKQTWARRPGLRTKIDQGGRSTFFCPACQPLKPPEQMKPLFV